MTEQQRERDIAEMEAQMAHDTDQYFEARPQIMRTRDKETTFEAGFKAAWAARPLSHAEGEAVDLEIGAGDVLICDLGTASAAGVAFYRDNAAHDVGTHHPELSGMGGTELAGRIFSVMTEKPESLVVLYNAVGRALATLGHPAPHAEGEAVDHWAVRNPGLADQFRAEAQAVRKRLGFESDADDVSPNDLRERIAEIEGAPQVAGLTETAIKSSPAYRALHREKEHLLGLLKDQAPQVAVPAGYTLVPVEPTHEMIEAGKKEADWYEHNAIDCYQAMLAAAPTAPAGEPDDSDICEQVELPHVLAWADGIRGDMWTEYADRITDEEARVAQAVWAAHTGEQPVSDPDGLPEPPYGAAHNGRVFADQVEQEYGFECQAGPIANCYEWQQLRRCLVAMAEYVEHAPDEREIAARALDDFMFDVAERVRLLSDSDQEARVLRKVNGWLYSRAKRLRAGQEGE